MKYFVLHFCLLTFCALSISAQTAGFKTAEQFLEAGNTAIARQDYLAAIDQYTRAIDLYPTVPEFYFNRAVAYRSTRRFDLAIKDFEKIIALDPKLPAQLWISLYTALGTVYQENGEYAKALQIQDKVLSLDASNADVYNNRGNTYVLLRQYAKALADFNKSLDLKQTALAYYSRARVYVEMRDDTRAIADYTRSVELDPSFAMAYNNRGLEYQKIGRLDLAVQDFSKAITLAPLDGVYYSNRANIYVKQKRFALTVKDYTKAIEFLPRWAEAHRRRANSYRKLGMTKLANADLQKAKELEKEGFDPANKIELIRP